MPMIAVIVVTGAACALAIILGCTSVIYWSTQKITEEIDDLRASMALEFHTVNRLIGQSNQRPKVIGAEGGPTPAKRPELIAEITEFRDWQRQNLPKETYGQ